MPYNDSKSISKPRYHKQQDGLFSTFQGKTLTVCVCTAMFLMLASMDRFQIPELQRRIISFEENLVRRNLDSFSRTKNLDPGEIYFKDLPPESPNPDPNRKTNTRFVHDLQDIAFPFARNPTDFRLQMAFARNHNDTDFLYTEEEVKQVLRGMYTMEGFMNQMLWSGSTAAQHFIGTASCLVQMKRPAMDVAHAVMHGMYLQEWKNWPRKAYSHWGNTCAARNYLASIVGSDLETMLWQRTALHGTGPWANWYAVQRQLQLLMQEDSPHYEKLSLQTQDRLKNLMGNTDLHMSICDEIEEYLSGDLVVAANWKRRDTEHWDRVAGLAEMLHEPKLVQWVRDTQRISSSLHANHPKLDYKQMTPPSRKVLFASETFNPNPADPAEVQRLKVLTTISREEHKLLNPEGSPDCFTAIGGTTERVRLLCDAFVNNEVSLTGYIDTMYEYKEFLMTCEHHGWYHEVILPEKVPLRYRQWDPEREDTRYTGIQKWFARLFDASVVAYLKY